MQKMENNSGGISDRWERRGGEKIKKILKKKETKKKRRKTTAIRNERIEKHIESISLSTSGGTVHPSIHRARKKRARSR